MSPKYAISKFAQHSPENDFHVIRVYSTIFGDRWQQKVVSGLDLGIPSSIFFTQKRPFPVILGAKNGTSDAQIQNRRPLFVANYPQKSWNRLLFHISFFRVFCKFQKSRILGSLLADFPLYNLKIKNL